MYTLRGKTWNTCKVSKKTQTQVLLSKIFMFVEMTDCVKYGTHLVTHSFKPAFPKFKTASHMHWCIQSLTSGNKPRRCAWTVVDAISQCKTITRYLWYEMINGRPLRSLQPNELMSMLKHSKTEVSSLSVAHTRKLIFRLTAIIISEFHHEFDCRLEFIHA